MEQLARCAAATATTGDRDDACAALMRGVVQLPDYLERLQGGHRDIPIVLLPLLNDLRTARGESDDAAGRIAQPAVEGRPRPNSNMRAAAWRGATAPCSTPCPRR